VLVDAIGYLVDHRALPSEMLQTALEVILAGQGGEAEVAALLTALRLKGESVDDLVTTATVLRRHMVVLDTGDRAVLDTCGTGGDNQGTFNVSTAAALVAAACGVPVVKHGNRGVSSSSGSADVLAALGVQTDVEPAVARRCLEETGFAFCFAPRFHPAARHVADVRRRLRFRTLFNLVGPLVNPARAAYQLIGVGRPEHLELLAGAAARLGTTRTYVVHGDGGLDEVTLSGPTHVLKVEHGTLTYTEWTPAQFGLSPCGLAECRVDGPAASAALIRRVFADPTGPAAELVLANTAAALLVAGRTASLAEGVDLARRVLRDGLPSILLDKLVSATRPPG
jgi:anthranilate phosphoribosyltransferase